LDEDFRQRLALIVTQTRGDMNQRDFGAKLEVSQATVVGWERGQNIPTLENLAKLAALRGQLPEELLAELHGRTYGADYPLEERVKIMTRAQLIALLGMLAERLKEKDL
jgi:transcriptional regulator with XRE-family HTH domain